MLRKLIATSATWVPIPLRIAMGVDFIAHGLQKVFGAFNGPGWAGWTAMSQMAPFSFMKPAGIWLGIAALSELIGGLLVLLGLFTRVGAFLIACVMLTAIIGVHWPNFFANNRGFEFPFVLLAVALALLISGSGQASVDRLIARR